MPVLASRAASRRWDEEKLAGWVDSSLGNKADREKLYGSLVSGHTRSYRREKMSLRSFRALSIPAVIRLRLDCRLSSERIFIFPPFPVATHENRIDSEREKAGG